MKKGISLVALVISLGVVIVLASTITVTGTNVYNNTKKAKFASELIYVQELINTYKLNNNGNIPTENVLHIDISDVFEEDVKNQFKDEIISDNKLFLYQIDLKKINAKELLYGNSKDSDSKDIYCYSVTTGKIYYISGVKIGTQTYYTLTDDLKNSINYVGDNNVNDGILFVYNNNYNNKGEIEIKIPVEYTEVLITSTDNNFTIESLNDNKYVTYKTISDINSVITISYKKVNEDEIKQIKYLVENIDKEAPSFEISDVKTMLNNETGQEIKYIQVENISDNLSGIKMIKYSNNVLLLNNSAKEYFKNKGINITEKKIIELSDDNAFNAVYVEDNAGNYAVKFYGDKFYLKEGLILHYDAEENTRAGYNPNSTKWEDLSGNNNDINLVNFNQSNWNENSLTFDGIDDYLENIEIKDTNEVTFQFVLKHDYTGKYMNIYEKYNMQQPMLWLDNSSKFEFCATYNLGDLFEDFSNKVTVITTTINSEKSNLYINMDKINYEFKGIANANGIYNLFNRNGENTYKGNVYAIRIYDRILTDEEIKYNYQIDKLRFNLE